MTNLSAAPEDRAAARAIVGTIARGRASVETDVRQIALDELEKGGVRSVRGVHVNREKQFIQDLLVNVANSNEADLVVLVGGVGVGPRDYTCEAVDGLAHRRLEGFGEAYRAMLREHGAGPEAMLQRATAAVYNRCLIFALPRQVEPLRLAIRTLIVPTLDQAVRVAWGPRA